MKIKGKIVNLERDFLIGDNRVTISTQDNILEEVEKYKMKPISIELKEYRDARSRDANGYAWALIGQIAQKLNEPSKEVYRSYIRECGVFDVLCIKEKAFEELKNKWEKMGDGFQIEAFPSKIDGCINCRVYYGSHTYNTKEMHTLIAKIVQDAKALDIETLTPNELKELESKWQ